MNIDQAYKGYIIRTGLIGDYFVGKTEYHSWEGKIFTHWFACFKSLEEAKKAIDLLV